MLLAGHLLALCVACAVFLWIYILHRRARAALRTSGSIPLAQPLIGQRPVVWLAVRSREPQAVRSALAATHVKSSDGRWFVAPQINGWTIATGSNLPNPTNDVDDCFHFLTTLSRKLGHVQFFYAEKILHHHAWARLDEGCVTRAYAWTGETVWNQGCETVAEAQLQLACFHYGESVSSWEMAEMAAANVEKIPLLAAHWSIDPGRISELLTARDGSAGEPPQFY